MSEIHRRAVIIAHVRVQTGLVVHHLVQVFSGCRCRLSPEICSSVISPPAPYLIECRHMIRRVCKSRSEFIRGKRNQVIIFVDQWHHTIFAVLGERAGEYPLSLFSVIDARVIAPSVGCEYERCDVIQFTVRGRTIRVSCSVSLAAPGKIALSRPILMLHIFLGPAPDAVKDVFPVKLHSDHHSVRHTLRAHIMILDVRDVA